MDCTAGCRLASHADLVLSAVTRENLNDVQHFVKYFCGNGAHACDSFGRNALHVAASCGRKDVLRWFLEQGYLNVDDKDKESGWTALHRSCYYGQLSCALLLLQFGANIYEKDSEGITPVELLLFDSSPKLCKKRQQKKGCSVSSWGTNTNFTLGHGDQKERRVPELIDVIAEHIKVNICQVVMCKFHTVFLASSGSVWTCGHGLGGRLGHGHEKTILVPKKVDALLGETCISVAAGQDHTVVLCESGNVFTFGLNKYHQMGHHPPSSHYLTPKQVQVKSLKGKRFVGIAAGTYHTVIYTDKEVYSFGLNAGQLGHSKGEKTQVVPRQVSALHLKDISIFLVTCNDTATVAVTKNGDVHLMYQYGQKRIISKLPNISKLIVVGGHLDESFKHITVEKKSPLVVYGLYEHGQVFQWRESDKSVRECHWSLQKAISVKDIACGKNLHVVTDHGEVYFEEQALASVKKPTKIRPRNLNFVKSNTALKQDEIIEVCLARVPHVHRAVKIMCDSYSQNFAVIQTDASTGCAVNVRVNPSEIRKHLSVLLDDSQTRDYDLEMKVGDNIISCHKFIIAHGGERIRKLIIHGEQSSDKTLIHFDDESADLIQDVVEFLYTGTCPSIEPTDVEGNVITKDIERYDSEESLDDLAWSLDEITFEDLDNFGDALAARRVGVQEEEERTVAKERARDRKVNGGRKQRNGRVLVDPSRKRELLRVAKKYKIGPLVSRLHDSIVDKKKAHPRFFRGEFPEHQDVVIEAEDGVEYACHKCILASRLEYFSIMLTTTWMESGDEFVHLKMPIPSRYLKVILDFLYTDEASNVTDSQDLEFIGNVLTVADQLWIIRLKEICEATLASLISLKNAVEMLEFSTLYNADQLRNVCMEFICRNMSCLFEARSLEFLSEDILDELSKAYREMFPSMAWRVLTPSDLHLSVPWPQPESPTKTRKGSRSGRKSRSSESEGGEGQAAQTNGTVAQVLFKKDETEEDEQTQSEQKTLENDVEPTEAKVVGLWYHKDTEMAPKLLSSTFVSSAGKTKTVSNPLPVSRKHDREKEEEIAPWGAQSFSPKSSDLRAIMEQERCHKENSQLNERKKEGKSPIGGKTRVSQKERKKLRRSSEEQILLPSSPRTSSLSEDKTTSPIPATKPSPWKTCSSVSPPALSFRDLVMQEEKEEKKTNQRTTETVLHAKTMKSSIVSASASPSVWQNHKQLASSPPSNSMKFDKIQEIQQQETVNHEKNRKKPLSLIQIEDKAIEQLLELYGGRFNPCEFIEVNRESRSAASPDWVK